MTSRNSIVDILNAYYDKSKLQNRYLESEFWLLKTKLWLVPQGEFNAKAACVGRLLSKRSRSTFLPQVGQNFYLRSAALSRTHLLLLSKQPNCCLIDITWNAQ